MSDTVAMLVPPPPTWLGESVKPASAAGLIVRVLLTEDPVILAVTRATVEVVTAVVAHGAEAVTEPAGTVIEAGPPHAELVEVRFALRPPDGAGDPSARVHVLVAPPVTVDGAKERLPSFAVVIVRVAFAELFPTVPVRVALVSVETAEVEIENVALVLPLGTTTLPGTDAAALEEVRATESPFPLAFPEIVTVPVLDLPPATDAGEMDRLLTVWAEIAADKVAIIQVTRRTRRKNCSCMGLLELALKSRAFNRILSPKFKLESLFEDFLIKLCPEPSAVSADDSDST